MNYSSPSDIWVFYLSIHENKVVVAAQLDIVPGHCHQVSKYFFCYKSYFQQNLLKVAIMVHCTIDQSLLTGAIL